MKGVIRLAMHGFEAYGACGACILLDAFRLVTFKETGLGCDTPFGATKAWASNRWHEGLSVSSRECIDGPMDRWIDGIDGCGDYENYQTLHGSYSLIMRVT